LANVEPDGFQVQRPMTGPLQISQDAFAAFMTLNEAVGTETDLSLLAVRAVKVLDLFLPGLTSTYYSRDGNLWKASPTAHREAETAKAHRG